MTRGALYEKTTTTGIARARRRSVFTGALLGSVLLGGIAAAGCSGGSVEPVEPVEPRGEHADNRPSPQPTAAQQPAQPQPSAQPAQPQPSATQPVQNKPAATQPQPTPAQPSPVQPPPVPTAQAQPTQPQPAQPPPKPAPVTPIGVTPASCVIKGTAPVAKDTLMHDTPLGGRVIGRFTGNLVPMAMSEIPPNPVSDRVKIVTSTGSGAVRIEGYVPGSAIPAFVTRDVPVYAGHVWISRAQKVKLVAATASSVTVEMTISGSRNQAVRGPTTCDGLALERGAPTVFEVPGNGRGYLTKESTTDIYDQPNGNVIFTLQMLEGSQQLFWSTETRAGFVHVQNRLDVTFDGWVRWASLEAIKKGEMMDTYIPPTSQVSGAQLALDRTPRVATAARLIPIRLRRDEKEAPIGWVEPGAEIYILETVAGWTNVLPKSLYLLPPEDFGFWVPSNEVP